MSRRKQESVKQINGAGLGPSDAQRPGLIAIHAALDEQAPGWRREVNQILDGHKLLQAYARAATRLAINRARAGRFLAPR